MHDIKRKLQAAKLYYNDILIGKDLIVARAHIS